MTRLLRTFVLRTALAGGVAPLATLAGAQGTTPAEHIQYVRIVARDYAFDAPGTLAAGIVTFHLVNQGSDLHQLSIIELGLGHTVKEFYEAMRAKGMPPAWSVTVGMTPTIPTNSEAFLSLRLTPGRYVLACMIPAKDGRSHVEKGMYLWVTAVSRSNPPAPAAAKKP